MAATEKTIAGTAPGLCRDAIGLREVLFQSITDMAPGAAIAASIPAGAALATTWSLSRYFVSIEPARSWAASTMSAGSARPLEDAFRIAQHDMVGWVASLCGLDPLDAYQLVTQAVESPLANVCDTNYTSIAKMAKRYLGQGAPMDGAHERLRDLAGEYRR